MAREPFWAVTLTYSAPTADEAERTRDVIAYTLQNVPWLSVSDVVGVPAEDEPTTRVDTVDTDPNR